MKKGRYIFLGLAMILLLAGCSMNRKTIRFGAAGIGGMYDSFSNAFVSLANKEDFSYNLKREILPDRQQTSDFFPENI